MTRPDDTPDPPRRRRRPLRSPAPGQQYLFGHDRKGDFIATFMGVEGEFWRVSIPTHIPGQARFSRAYVRDAKGRKQPLPTVEKLIRPELLREVKPHGVD